MILNFGTLGIYLCVSLLLGISLTFNVFQPSGAQATPPKRLVGIGMLCDAVAIVIGGFIFQIVEPNAFLRSLLVFVDLLTSFFLTLTGFSLLQGGYPRWKTIVLLASLMLLPWCLLWLFGVSSQLFSILSCAVSVLIVAYVTVRIWKHDKSLSLRYSNIEKRKYIWFVYFSLWILLVTPLYQISTYMGAFEGYFPSVCYLIMSGMYVYLARSVSMMNFQVGPAVTDESQLIGEDAQPQESVATNPCSHFTLFEQEKMERQLYEMMNTEKVFINPDLSVDDLAKMMHTNSSYFYYFMRDVMHTNFFDMVNGYRIEYAKPMLLGGDRIEDVALRCGYNSANSFRRVFKKITGMTPSEWRAMK